MNSTSRAGLAIAKLPARRRTWNAISTATVASLATSGFTPVVNPAYNSSATPGLVTPFPTVYGYAQDRLPASPATARASRVLPVPGGPFSSTPLGMRPPSLWNFSGLLRNSTIS